MLGTGDQVSFRPTVTVEPSGNRVELKSISAMPEYTNNSFEELRTQQSKQQ